METLNIASRRLSRVIQFTKKDNTRSELKGSAASGQAFKVIEAKWLQRVKIGLLRIVKTTSTFASRLLPLHITCDMIDIATTSIINNDLNFETKHQPHIYIYDMYSLGCHVN